MDLKLNVKPQRKLLPVYNTTDSVSKDDQIRRRKILSEIRFQAWGEKGYEPKPGIRSGKMIKKLLVGTPFATEEEYKRTLEAATKRRAGQLRTYYTRTGKLIPYSSKRPGDFSYPKASELFYPKKWLQAKITTNIGGEHTEYLTKLANLRRQHRAELKAAEGKPEAVIKSIKRRHRREETSGVKDLGFPGSRRYLKEVQKKQPPLQISGERRRFRGALVEHARERRDIIQAIRKREGTAGKMFPPIPGQGKIGTAYRISGQFPVEKEQFLEKMAEVRGPLHEAMAEHVKRRAEIAGKIEKYLQRRAERTIPQIRKAGGSGPLPHAKLAQEVRKVVHPLLHSPIAPESVPLMQQRTKIVPFTKAKPWTRITPEHEIGGKGPTPMPAEIESIANRLGFKRPERVEQYRNLYQKLTQFPESTAGEIAIRRHVLASPKFWKGLETGEPVTKAVIPKGYPHFRKIGIGAGITAGVLGAGYLARKLTKKKETRFAVKEKDTTLGHDIAIGGIEGGLGYLGTEKLVSKIQPKSRLGKFGLAAAVGGAATGTIGLLLNRAVRRAKQIRQQQQMSARLREIRFANYNPPMTEGYSAPYNPKRKLTVAQDRYRKMVREREIYRKEANLGKSALAGAILGAIAHPKRLTAGAVGAGAGLAAETGLLLHGRKTRDPFGEETIASKRIERIPWQAGGLAAAGILGRRLYKRYKFNSKNKLIEFKEEKRRPTYVERLEKRIARNPYRVGEQAQVGAKRIYRLTKDISEKIRTGKVVDVRGRAKTPEYKKTWFVGGAVTLGLGSLLARKRLIQAGGYYLGRGLQKAKNYTGKLPGAKPVGEFFKGTHEEAKSFIKKVKRKFPVPPTEADVLKRHKEAEEAKRKSLEQLRRMYEKGFRGKVKQIQFAVTVPTWDIRDERGRSARIYAPGSQKRQRRQKYWHEKKSTRDLLTAILVPTIGVGTAGAGYFGKSFLEGRRTATGGPEIKPVKATGTKISGVISKPVKKAKPFKHWKDIVKGLSARTKEIRFVRGERSRAVLGWLGEPKIRQHYQMMVLRRGTPSYGIPAKIMKLYRKDPYTNIHAAKRLMQKGKIFPKTAHLASPTFLSKKLDDLINFSSITYHETESAIHRRKAGVHQEKAYGGYKVAGLAAAGGTAAARLFPGEIGSATMKVATRISPKLPKFLYKYPRQTVYGAAFAPAITAGTYAIGHQVAGWRQKRLASKEQNAAQEYRRIRNARASYK